MDGIEQEGEKSLEDRGLCEKKSHPGCRGTEGKKSFNFLIYLLTTYKVCYTKLFPNMIKFEK